MRNNISKKYLNELSYELVGAAIEVSRNLGPGLLETVYQRCLTHELKLREIPFLSELNIPINYKGLELDCFLRCDFIVESRIILEIKAVESLQPIHEAQLLTYMKLLKAPKGLLLNFNCVNIFKEGHKSFVNEFFRDLPEY